MPQMNPLLWMNLFLFFMSIFFMINSFLYFFVKLNNKPMPITHKSKTSNNWLW